VGKLGIKAIDVSGAGRCPQKNGNYLPKLADKDILAVIRILFPRI